MGFHPANFGLPRPFRSRVSLGRDMRQTDGRTDRHQPSFYNVPPYGGRGNTLAVPVIRMYTN